MKVNGEQVACDTPMNITQLIESRGLNSRRVAVELNGSIVPRAQRETTMLKDSDTVEIVSFVQGG
ncbi:MAG: sulfur carrier protein ThiS [Bifidobacteriaceae bacterium]|nr:sulfur carrier protein ThiS [Bifidobacteriaceae bacterium]